MDIGVINENVDLDGIESEPVELVEPVPVTASSDVGLNLDSASSSSFSIDENLLVEQTSTYSEEDVAASYLQIEEPVAETFSDKDAAAVVESANVEANRFFIDETNSAENDNVVGSIIGEHVEPIGGDDIDEWVECDEDENDDSYTLRWRILLAMIAITLVAAFFYFLEKHRRKQSSSITCDQNEKDRPKKSIVNGNLDDEQEKMKAIFGEHLDIDPLLMAGIDFKQGENLKLKIDRRTPTMTLTTPGGTDHWDSEFFFNYKLKSAKDVCERVDEDEEQNMPDDEIETDNRSEAILRESIDDQKQIDNHQEIDDQSDRIDIDDRQKSESENEKTEEEENWILDEALVQKLILENQSPDRSEIADAESNRVDILEKLNELKEQTIFDNGENQSVAYEEELKFKEDIENLSAVQNEQNHIIDSLAKIDKETDQAVAENDSQTDFGQNLVQVVVENMSNCDDQRGDLEQNYLLVTDLLDQPAVYQVDQSIIGLTDQALLADLRDQSISVNEMEYPVIDQSINDQPITDQSIIDDALPISESADRSPMGEDDMIAMATEYVDIHSKSQADSVHAAAVGDDYDHVTAEVQLTLKKPKADKKQSDQSILPLETESAINLLDAPVEVEVDGGREASMAPDLEAGVEDHVDSVVIAEEAEMAPAPEVFIEIVSDEDNRDESLSRSDDPPSLCEHTTAPEIETFEVSDVEIEQEDEEAVAPPPLNGDDEQESPQIDIEVEIVEQRQEKKNGSPPVILTQVTATAPGHRRSAVGNSGVRLLKVETDDQPLPQKTKESIDRLINGASTKVGQGKYLTAGDDDDDEDNAKMSSVFEVIGARNMDEALIKMETLEAVTRVIRLAGLEASNLIFGIDYTASNKYQGEISYGGESLHKISPDLSNPYQQVITIMGQTLAPFAKGGYIPAYGFGDIRTSDTSIFPLKSNGYCKSFAEVLDVYNEITPKVILSGPTNFAPLIYQAIEICKEFRCYHILVIVADGQVTNERATRRAIVDACRYPLSIIVVGVGDGPWEMMRVFDEKLPKRPWDNFHFIEFYKVTAGAKQPDLSFAVQSLLEIPDQYKSIKALGLLNFDY